ncbi:RNA-guided endonuclease InsQ/TnpB family protein [Ligilactobacillus equi]|uniref:Transposase orf b n=1 Tax=Ligilactobacillus equi DPC 6820 TaxID=1392007 RepID=V7HWB5_9LACO|nr:RNA-guided endonuclease TnpB family protein [Ligilactobacillus equi]ETA74534.1 transposase orf b [Ligilactobacillus equi DPC 6820]
MTEETTLLTSEYVITDKTGKLDEIAKEANNLYNASLYQTRQAFFKGKILSATDLDRIFKKKYQQRENMLYHKLGYVQSAQQTLREVNSVFGAWLKALKAYKASPFKFTGRPRMPKYLDKGKRHIFFVTNQNAKVKNGYLVIPKLEVKLKLADNLGKIKRVAFKPLSKKHFKVLVQYEVNNISKLKSDNGIYVGIDPGLDNAFTCVTNGNQKPLIINGKGVKSVNQFYNKQKAQLQKLHAINKTNCKEIKTKQGIKTVYFESNQTLTLTDWRNTKIKQFAHKVTKRIIDYALNCGANTIVIGKNKDQKRSVNMGRRNNQNFIGIPHQVMINMLIYKAKLQGINVIQTNESYTSQTSFLDNEKPVKQNGNYHRKLKGLSPNNRRIKRGLFKSNQGKLINADVNGAYQIMRKVFPKVNSDGIVGLVFSPVKYSVEF